MELILSIQGRLSDICWRFFLKDRELSRMTPRSQTDEVNTKVGLYFNTTSFTFNSALNLGATFENMELTLG